METLKGSEPGWEGSLESRRKQWAASSRTWPDLPTWQGWQALQTLPTNGGEKVALDRLLRGHDISC